MLKQRIITALVLIPIVVLAVFFLRLEAFAVLVAMVVLLAAWEWTGFIKGLEVWQRYSYLIATSAMMLLIVMNSLPLAFWHGWLMPAELSDWLSVTDWALLTIVLGCLWWLVAFLLVLVFPRVSSVLVRSKFAMLFIGWLILLPTWVALTGLRSISIGDDYYRGAGMLMLALTIVWAADVGAYFAGKSLGRVKLAPHVSPKKTWEGVLGGALLAAAISYAGLCLLGIKELSLSLIMLVTLMVAGSVVGDLTESIFKRLSDTKDSGHILPGHGGILDRIDGLTAALPICILGFAILGIR